MFVVDEENPAYYQWDKQYIQQLFLVVLVGAETQKYLIQYRMSKWNIVCLTQKKYNVQFTNLN